jgi:hypothetical protein
VVVQGITTIMVEAGVLEDIEILMAPNYQVEIKRL